MIINSKRRRLYFLAALPLSIIVACVFTTGAYVFKVHPAPFELAVFVELLCGIFFAVAIGMLFNEDSRINGFIYAIAFAMVTYFYMISPGANVNLLLMMCSIGLIVGTLCDINCVLHNRYDFLALIAKILLTVLYLTIVGFLLYEMWLAVVDVTEAYAAQSIFFFGAGIILATILYWIALKVTIGVRASEIFVFGPRSSGKTYFVLGLWKYISDNYNKGHTNDGVVLTGDPNDDGDDLKLSNLYSIVLDGKILPRTYRYQMVIYELKGKKFGLIPVKWTVVDYAGEYYDELNEINFKRAISLLSAALKLSPAEIRRNAGTMDFVRFIKFNHADKLLDPEFTKSVIIATMYGNFLKAGKVIFLVDGEKITDNRKGHSQLAKEFGGYMKTLIDLEDRNFFGVFKSNKKFAVVVTKSDLVLWKNKEIRNLIRSMNASKLSDVPEKSKQALAIENSLFEILRTNLVFKNLINMMDDISMHFIAVSVDATAEPFPTEEGMEEEIAPTDLAPWRFSEVFKFGR
ncbi:MAG: hypothetical protein IK060_00595 [Methanomicrobium sp.]|nr:hypothetical protein [Methanomicrobium sp.]MBO4522085.1 hypothetical protein [Methanomicrobium sp.]MBR6010833.1 hypothetical protein [Methanomicrobium sp.]MBR6496881.1 hypothetical protein [Methanomicrobium sp.]